ncbi:aspartic proteinase-like protein 2, partial [Tanacetum coccineum]
FPSELSPATCRWERYPQRQVDGESPEFSPGKRANVVVYLLQQSSVGGAVVWCIGFQKIRGQGITILGDLVLKDRIVVYDLGGQRIGWANYDCTSAVNVSTTSTGGRSEYVNAGQIGSSSSLLDTRDNLLLIFIVAFGFIIASFS